MPPEVTDFNEDELEAPEWMNAEFFTTVLKHCMRRDDIGVKEYKMSPATAKGDHYASVMFRGIVKYYTANGDDNKSLIIKIMPEQEGEKKDMFGDSFIFETEIGMYTDMIPKLEALLKEVGDETAISPPCLYHSLTPRKLIVFEDIVPRSYSVVRGRDINLEELKGAYTKLAKMQASSLKLMEKDPSSFDIYRYPAMSMESLNKSPYIANGMKLFIEMLEKEPSLQEYVKYFEPVKENIIERAKEPFNEYWSANRREGALYVLGHGDFHAKNMMFKHDATGRYEDVLLVDFQMSYMGSFVLDVMYSMIMLVNKDVRFNHMTELFSLYIDVFNATVDKIGYTGRRPDMNELLEEVRLNRHWLVLLLSVFHPMWGLFTRGELDIAQLNKSEEYQRSLFQSSDLIEEYKLLLPKYKSLGYFDDL